MRRFERSTTSRTRNADGLNGTTKSCVARRAAHVEVQHGLRIELGHERRHSGCDRTAPDRMRHRRPPVTSTARHVLDAPREDDVRAVSHAGRDRPRLLLVAPRRQPEAHSISTVPPRRSSSRTTDGVGIGRHEQLIDRQLEVESLAALWTRNDAGHPVAEQEPAQVERQRLAVAAPSGRGQHQRHRSCPGASRTTHRESSQVSRDAVESPARRIPPSASRNSSRGRAARRSRRRGIGRRRPSGRRARRQSTAACTDRRPSRPAP